MTIPEITLINTKYVIDGTGSKTNGKRNGSFRRSLY